VAFGDARPVRVWRLAAVALLASASAASAAPARIASLNLAADEVLVELVPLARLVAVTAQADDPGMSNVVGRLPKGLPRFFRADLERLISLRPDLVVVSEYTDPDFLRLLERSGIAYHRMEGLHGLAGYRQAILDLGRAVGAEPRAAALVARYDASLRALAHALEGAPRPRVLYWASGMSAGADTAIGALIECGGGRNVAAEIGLTGVRPLASERAFVANPDRVLVGVWPGVLEELRDDPLLARLPAVVDGRVDQMPTALLVTVSHHAAEACWDLAARLHPALALRPPP
jgi:ABC-type Fe3+-hydroxamate transport system substrate-binding protein